MDTVKFLVVIFCTIQAMVSSEKNMDLKSILLQILHNVKTDVHSDNPSGNNLANSDLLESVSVAKTSDSSHTSNELTDLQKDIIKDATKDILNEINRLKAKYGNLLQTSENGDDGVVKLKDSESVIGDLLEITMKKDNFDEAYVLLVKEMNDAAKTLLLLRSKLATEYKIIEDELQLYTEEDSKKSKEQENVPKMDRLMNILTGIASFMEKAGIDKQEELAPDTDNEMLKLTALDSLQHGNQIENDNTMYGSDMQAKFDSKDKSIPDGLVKENQAQRDWHIKSCGKFKAPCLGWFPDCCEAGQIGKIKFNMCCSFSYYNLKGKDNLSGICIPNAYGHGQCVQNKLNA